MSELDQFLQKNKWILYLFLLFSFGLGLAVRLYDLTDAPLDFNPTRQLHSALMARGMYYQNLDSAPDWQREMAVQQWKAEGLIEPPFMEWLTATTYCLTGQENLWYARLYSIFFWMLGAAALFLLAKEISGAAGALIGAIYFLLLPFAGIASRSFQPDPLLVSMIIWTYWAMSRWHRSSNWKWALIAGVLGGLAILVKSVAVFFIAGPWIGLILSRMKLIDALKDIKIWAIVVLSIFPYAVFHIYGVYISGLLTEQFSLRFFPQLWVDPVWYLQWKGMIDSTVRFIWFLLAILGIFQIEQKPYRGMVLGMLIGYLVYGFTFSYHISTHDYYQLPLVPIIALGLAAGAKTIFSNLKGAKWLANLAVLFVVLAASVTSAWDIRVQLKRQDYRSEMTFWQNLGQTLGDNASVIGLTQDYGYRLKYWGWVNAENWMTSGDFNLRMLAGQDFDMQKLFEDETAGRDYFVVTMLEELDHQPEVKNLLYENYPIVDQTDEYVIFDLRGSLEEGTPPQTAP